MAPSTPENVPCPGDDIAAYVDGELTQPEAASFEDHLSMCTTCRIELNHQKEFLAALSASLISDREIPLPKNFTRTIVVNAESRVSGLRRPRERFTAIFICTALFFFALFALGGDAETVGHTFGGIAEKILAVGSYLMRLLFSISFGFAVVSRSLFLHISFSWLLPLVLVCAALFALSRSLLRGSRTQEN